ncbi:collagenase 3-like [Alosa sapidissima]|uniref:collagenase 3-like n=1 Tax=Alosa sapidissima TaxID=34773 RepID=UPI001C099C11|nr:collagenase 3-like [Alosa sapidissima]
MRWTLRMQCASMEVCVTTLLLLVCAAWSEAAPVSISMGDTAASEDDQTLAEDYLERFFSDVGTSNGTIMRSVTENASFKDNLEAMQSFFGLEVTGTLDKNTIEVMKAPRCGVSDISRYGHFAGRPKWEKKLITYRITIYTRDLSQREVDYTIGQAFKLYSDIIPLDFKQITSGTADIMILFKGRYHGDFWPFDGSGGVLAHASSPGQGEGGDTHFDDDENWTLTSRGVNLLLVAAHEFGHALGLDHSRDRSALMYPTYQYVNTNGYKLPDDDRLGVQNLYGTRKGTAPDPTPPPPKPKPRPRPGPRPGPRPDPAPAPGPNPKDEQCSRSLVFDAATSINGDLYFFKNGYYWRRSRMIRGIPLIKVQTTWPQITYVDAACEIPSKAVYLFQGNKFWKINPRDKTILPGYPKTLSSLGFASSVDKIDAALYEPLTKTIFFYKGAQYWSYNPRREQMYKGYPRALSVGFPGIGNKVDAAFENYGYLYFSNGARQVEYNYRYLRVQRTLLNYGWLNCY